MITDALGRLETKTVEPLDWATKIVASFDYRDVRRQTVPGFCKILLPPGDGPFPLYFQAGYEMRDATLAGMVGFGCVVVNPVSPTAVWAAGETPLRRSINLDVAALHIARSLDCVDDTRVVLGGGSAGGLMAWMLTAESFPLAGSIPDAAEVNAGYNAWYLARTHSLQEGMAEPLMPAVARTYEVVAGPLRRHPPRGEMWLQHSPVGHAEAITSPVHYLHATADLLHPAEQIARSLRRPPEGLPAGFTTEEGEPWLFLEDVFPDLRVVPVKVPRAAEVAEVDGRRIEGWLHGRPSPRSPGAGESGRRTKQIPVSLPDPGDRMVACVVEDGGPGPLVGHFRYALGFLRGAFLSRVLAGPCDAKSQLTAGKRRVLDARLAGEDWIRTPLSHLDFPEAERADVERGLSHVR